MEGYKHLIECHCVLPQYRNTTNPIFHKFVVFSVIDDDGAVVSSLSRCENCGAVHKVIDICKSEIMTSKEDSRSLLTKRDLSSSLPAQLVQLFEEYGLSISDYEAAKFYIDNEKWGSTIILNKELEEDGFSGKMLTFVSSEKFRVDPFFYKDTV